MSFHRAATLHKSGVRPRYLNGVVQCLVSHPSHDRSTQWDLALGGGGEVLFKNMLEVMDPLHRRISLNTQVFS